MNDTIINPHCGSVPGVHVLAVASNETALSDGARKFTD